MTGPCNGMRSSALVFVSVRRSFLAGMSPHIVKLDASVWVRNARGPRRKNALSPRLTFESLGSLHLRMFQCWSSSQLLSGERSGRALEALDALPPRP
jgi:hypothetical protein